MGRVALSARTDPLIGTTTFAYDPFNRRIGVADVNGVLTETRYDDLDRVTHSIQRSDDLAQPGDPTVAADLVTEQQYNAFGDLFRTILPRGNLIEYGYDAAGRLIAVERKPDLATPGERTVYQLDGAGNRTRKELQRWDGLAYVVESFTDYQPAAAEPLMEITA
jgi:YD repeat-containing protein